MAGGFAAETEPAKYPGLKELRVVADVNAVTPGEDFFVGLWFRHEEGYHTYWKSPGIVGVPAIVDWKNLPKGFSPGEIQWPAPQKTLMASLNAWGYETDTCLLIPIEVPADLRGRKEITLKGRIGWMCCATSCHPGHHDFSMTLPVNQAGKKTIDKKWSAVFDDSRKRFPQAASEGWKFMAEEINADTIQLVIHAPTESEAIDWSKVYFFSDDNQVDSDEPQKISELSGRRGAVFTFSRPDFAPKNPLQLSGVLHYPDGWPNLDHHPWMIASAPWPGYEEPSTDGSQDQK